MSDRQTWGVGSLLVISGPPGAGKSNGGAGYGRCSRRRFARGRYAGVVGSWFLATFAKATGLEFLEYVILLPSVERCVKQVAERDGHGFSDEGAAWKMHKEFEDASIAERHVLVDPWDSLDAVVDRISAALSRGDLRYWVRATG